MPPTPSFATAGLGTATAVPVTTPMSANAGSAAVPAEPSDSPIVVAALAATLETAGATAAGANLADSAADPEPAAASVANSAAESQLATGHAAAESETSVAGSRVTAVDSEAVVAASETAPLSSANSATPFTTAPSVLAADQFAAAAARFNAALNSLDVNGAFTCEGILQAFHNAVAEPEGTAHGDQTGTTSSQPSAASADSEPAPGNSVGAAPSSDSLAAYDAAVADFEAAVAGGESAAGSPRFAAADSQVAAAESAAAAIPDTVAATAEVAASTAEAAPATTEISDTTSQSMPATTENAHTTSGTLYNQSLDQPLSETSLGAIQTPSRPYPSVLPSPVLGSHVPVPPHLALGSSLLEAGFIQDPERSHVWRPSPSLLLLAPQPVTDESVPQQMVPGPRASSEPETAAPVRPHGQARVVAAAQLPGRRLSVKEVLIRCKSARVLQDSAGSYIIMHAHVAPCISPCLLPGIRVYCSHLATDL